MIDIALATSAAPIYFPECNFKKGSTRDYYIDGALAFNNPSLILLALANYYVENPKTDLFTVSISTGLTPSVSTKHEWLPDFIKISYKERLDYEENEYKT